ncbi:glycosyl hydrolase family 18 protein [Paracidobacterium acidisoli]|uniref:Glycosyl hydrolase n=1 Tax=Paracidobacterium acidisoli TaxID=2303751 RepID=A0A372IIX0_9BACT|nr:glycosyl hydrolase family 18 protein [Paracidobacterium acidisoli]MBT9333361.1 glycosyl hydrolase [Paracidobacterium acidisoli]
MTGRLLTAALLAFTALTSLAQQPKALFYMTQDPGSVRDFLAHAQQIDILVPTWYIVDQDGLIQGGPNPLVAETAKRAHVPVMPIVASRAFDQADFHSLVNHPERFPGMFQQMIDAAKQNGYIGYQFDFENIAWTDRDALSRMVAAAADAMHHAGLQLTIATVPAAPGHPGASDFSRWIYANWRGAYDLAALAKSVDLICLMTYDQHTRWTVPGPVAGWSWTTENLDYALKFVPPQKLSLGIPLYGYHWFTGAPQNGKPNPTAEYIGGEDALLLAKTWNGHVQWDPVDHTAWLWFYRDDMREWIFFTDQHTFEDRYDLAKQHGLQGFCSWVLGQEDQSIWKSLPHHD